MGRSLVLLSNRSKATVLGTGWRGAPGRVRRQAGHVRILLGKAMDSYFRASFKPETKFDVHLKLLSEELMAEGQARKWCQLGGYCSSAGLTAMTWAGDIVVEMKRSLDSRSMLGIKSAGFV